MLLIILFVVVMAVLLPSRYLVLPTDKDHPLMNRLRSQSSQMISTGLHQLEQTEKELAEGLHQLEVVAEKGLYNGMHKLEEKLEKWANGSSTSLDTLDSGSADAFNHLYQRVDRSDHPSRPKKRRIAFAITITKDGLFQDGAAVLAYSIFNISKHSSFDISLVAFVHPNVTTSRPTLQKLGFHVIEAPTPINVTAISTNFTFLRDKIDKNGCCGASELIKLNSYRLVQYEWVVHMDADTYLLNPISELFNTNYSLIYTTDPNMATFKKEHCQPAQGGFLVLRPSVADYSGLINTIMTTGFFKGSGWNRSHIGWFWGGMTVQGILPYYYNLVTLPGRSAKVDRCVYNTMADTKPCE